ncbi:hypothetical protein JTE90_016202 [Oedothorax gibbosus]|uniref:Nuclear cap-binding protein subunit 3 n=1 Tax=Oedothorax gibbosus TaxID=931172 RepID=A0AAV6UKV9_9ARAC|nr:hypothetical protein JTE90_016202 [Oedothorax gibbosus]
MAQLFMGKLLPNLNISLDNEADDIIEEGEISDDEDITEDPITIPPITNVEPPEKNVNIVRGWMQTLHAPKIYENKNGGFVTGIDLSSEELMKKLEDRAERFGLQRKEEAPITQNEINALYKSLEIDPANLNSCKLKNIRLDALHMRGVDEMSTNEIFKYFGKYGPASVEWINDYSCNVVWLDEATTARALLGSSQPLKVKKKNTSILISSEPPSENVDKKADTGSISELSDSDEEDEDSRKARYIKSNPEATMDVDAPTIVDEVDCKSIDIPVPPGHWRVGEPHPKAKALLLRFATKDDKKIRGAEKRSQYYQKYGNPNYGGMKGLISKSRKRKMQSAKNREAVDQFNDDSADPKILHTTIIKLHGYAASLKHQPKPGSIYSRLGTKYTKDDLIHLGSKFSSESEEEEDDDIEINCTVPSKFNIWTDLAKSMAKEDRTRPQNEDSSDLESELDSYRNLRAQESRNLKKSADLDSELDSYRGKRSHSSRNLKSADLDSELDSYRAERSQNLKRSDESRMDSYRLDSRQPRNYERSGDSRTRSSRSSRNRLDKGDLRSTLSSMSKRRDTSKEGRYSRRRDEKSFSRRRDPSQEDLRSKLKRLKREDSEPRKYRSPLCLDD